MEMRDNFFVVLHGEDKIIIRAEYLGPYCGKASQKPDLRPNRCAPFFNVDIRSPDAQPCGQNLQTNNQMPKYIIEREIPGAGNLTGDQLQGISQKSCHVLRQLGAEIQWVESYVTDAKVYCVYIAPNEEIIREHAKQGGFPANRISEVKQVIDPTTAG